MEKFTKGEEYILSESPEISLGERRGWLNQIFKIFPAFKNRNYRLYFTGQLISITGTWLQIVAQGWLVLKLTNSAFLIGLVAAVATLPTLLFSLFGGVIVDRFSKRRILAFTQATAMILALILGLLTFLNIINLWEIIVLAFLLGVVMAIDVPARQAFVVEMVGKEDLPSAIALNSAIFNGARVIGPSLAGFLIAWIGVAGVFITNGISYVAVVIALFLMRLTPAKRHTHSNPLLAIKEGITYSAKHPIIRTLLVFAGVTTIFGWSYATMLPYIAEHTFNVGPEGLGYLYAASGIGAVSATVVISAFAKKASPMAYIFGGNCLFAIGAIMFSLTTNIFLAYGFLFLLGFGLLLQFSMINTVIQSMVEDRYRGRVMSIYTVMFLGMAPLGNLQVGFFSENFGTGFAIQLGAVVTFLFGLLIFLNRKRIRERFKDYDKQNQDFLK